jgi:hypothetical protein
MPSHTQLSSSHHSLESKAESTWEGSSGTGAQLVSNTGK